MQGTLDLLYVGEIAEFQCHAESENDEFRVVTY